MASRGFDTGPVAEKVFEKVVAGSTWKEAATAVDREYRGNTAGCNPLHRSLPLALFDLADQELAEAAMTDARLTHRHPLAGDVAAAAVVLAHGLLSGEEWAAALRRARQGRREETVAALDTYQAMPWPPELGPAGFAPQVLAEAVWAVGESESFDEAFGRSLEETGTGNYAPVVAGALAGARFGREAIPQKRLAEARPELIHRAETLAS